MSLNLADEVRERRSLPTPAVARALRQSAGISQARLALAVGVTKATIARWEGASRQPSGEHRARYAAALTELQEALAA